MKIIDKNKINICYKALLERDTEYTGVFFVGVKTTSVFCISVCRARKPKKENVEFYTDIKSVLDAGFRPCKICRPMENAHSAPRFIEEALDLVRATPKTRISDTVLRKYNISPERVRRWFLQNHGITFHAFQRMQRVNSALQELKGGRATIEVAFDNGYESLSGFGYTYKQLIGVSPTEPSDVIMLHRFTSPLGPMFVCATERGVCLLEFTDHRMLEVKFSDLQRLLKAKIISGENKHTQQAEKEIGEYFAGKRLQFDLLLDTPGSDFQRIVWQQLCRVPFGKTSHSQKLFEQVERQNSVREVAAANGANRIAIVIPCHRIIGKGGYGGVARKKWLIEHEKTVLKQKI
ncbi:methylated-DNA--[protein]-cysteine S-methyltransferase [Xenorhabdus sp. 12]|uniref:Methylated-DNA--[protein]-cysteine S-methyltransferase n=1 Tax=Xenorhabdus santafensis TaxID=2582833 RepID=A0ABU4S7P7_9GAMM|nr:methylated-DNA--[protein]-cysteine S-methyltransferase [Xenorhabdus sp. 12]MDX7986496.1 methylated-DNA--[protein]-cysteine S-methyltransferase [Xenorhabdus sp. 12]